MRSSGTWLLFHSLCMSPNPCTSVARPESLGMENTHRALCPCVCVRVCSCFLHARKKPARNGLTSTVTQVMMYQKCHSRPIVKNNSDMTHITSQAHTRTHWVEALSLSQLPKPGLSRWHLTPLELCVEQQIQVTVVGLNLNPLPEAESIYKRVYVIPGCDLYANSASL